MHNIFQKMHNIFLPRPNGSRRSNISMASYLIYDAESFRHSHSSLLNEVEEGLSVINLKLNGHLSVPGLVQPFGSVRFHDLI